MAESTNGSLISLALTNLEILMQMRSDQKSLLVAHLGVGCALIDEVPVLALERPQLLLALSELLLDHIGTPLPRRL